MNISLTDQEKFIISYLRSAKKSIPSLKNVDMRIAGGWVRDKIMGILSDDIDVAVSNISGHDVVSILKNNDFKNVLGKTFQVSLDKSLKSENKTDLQSLQVGGVEMGGLKVEFVPMRTERYEEDSRAPILEITDDPRLDAMRRDLTINGLYYNIDTGMVEDYVGGIEDIKNMTLKTPDNAKKTFSEDPLRILRALRFYSKYPNSTIDSEIITAIKDPEVQRLYLQKVAPERAGKEIMKLMSGEKPDEAIRVLFESGMHRQVFGADIFDKLNPLDMDQKTPHHKHNLMEHTLLTMKNVNNISRDEGLSDKERALMTMSAMFHDIG
jgi:tRNA nucleotidyltransferase (CCA-adding enzyme)